MNDQNDLDPVPKERRYLPKWPLWLDLGIIAMVTIRLTKNVDMPSLLQQARGNAENSYPEWGGVQTLQNPWILRPFATSLLTGFKVSRQVVRKSDAVLRWGGLAMLLLGGYYVMSGILWFF